jgi:hypothetical protein
MQNPCHAKQSLHRLHSEQMGSVKSSLILITAMALTTIKGVYNTDPTLAKMKLNITYEQQYTYS